MPILAFAEPSRWFPWPWLQGAWVCFDLALGLAFVTLARRYRPSLAVGVFGLVAIDALVTLTEVLVWKLPRIEGLAELVAVRIACTGPILATLALRLMIVGRSEIRARTP